METSLPSQWGALCLLVLLLGVRHGFDADHLATIDGMTRYNMATRPTLARQCGALFSIGHGAIVFAIALAVGAYERSWPVPAWMEAFGNCVSIGILALLGVANVWNALAAAPGAISAPVGLKSRLLGPLGRASSAAGVMFVGALFALSFDTLSQTVLFSMAGLQFGGVRNAAMLGLLFLLGMLFTDGLNGLWIARLLRRADQRALLASRIMGFVVGALSLLVALWGAMRLLSPYFAAWSEQKETALGVAVVALALGGSLLARCARSFAKGA